MPYALCLTHLTSTSPIYNLFVVSYTKELKTGGDQMDLWRKIGVTIIFGIVAIIGGGLFWVLSEDWAVVFTYLSIVGFFLMAFLINPEQIVNEVTGREEPGEH